MKTQVQTFIAKAKDSATLKAFHEQAILEYFTIGGIAVGMIGAFLPLMNVA